ncbi:hypothetical protein D0C36_10545 [Mucilaginibacter conchicola]|uniref:Uncharacterized protein n=1 Tax=Mucilaginibacter conchicola TaxID=2303333 RepID=A0A372NRH9_9SPHI|nr:hypothetical protein [Mucilaginibacter conchicola]RFZ91880.1 hypothetical protein D0C36_10545 [Mucilaginibacter conchicola]
MIELTIGILGLIVAGLTYKKTFLEKPKAELEHLVLQFKMTQRKSIEVRTKLREYAEEHQAYSKELFSGITIGSYLIMLEESYNKNLNDDLLMQIKELNPSKLILDSMNKSLGDQVNALIQVENLIWSLELKSKDESAL